MYSQQALALNLRLRKYLGVSIIQIKFYLNKSNQGQVPHARMKSARYHSNDSWLSSHGLFVGWCTHLAPSPASRPLVCHLHLAAAEKLSTSISNLVVTKQIEWGQKMEAVQPLKKGERKWKSPKKTSFTQSLSHQKLNILRIVGWS